MKKINLFSFFLMGCILMCCVFMYTSCISDKKTDLPTKLSTPAVTLTDDLAQWNSVPHADKFEISVNGNLSYIENSVISRKLIDGQSFKIRAVGDGINYSNSDWSNLVKYTKQIPQYTVTWINGNSVLEIDEKVEQGATPSYDGIEPQKEADSQFQYKFKGWSPQIGPVLENTVYIAEFTAIPIVYTVIWKNGDDILETDENMLYGSVPSYDGAEPIKASTAKYVYQFVGWSPKIEVVTQSITYQAEFEEKIRTYTVTFLSEDGKTVLEEVEVEFGSNAEYSKATPVKSATDGYTYAFDKWVSDVGSDGTADLTNIRENKNVYAHFESILRKVSVHIASNNTDYGKVSVAVLNDIPYGSKINVQGNALTIDGQSVSAIPNSNTPQYSYEFLNWSTEEAVGNNTIITANFTRAVNSYTITWKNGDTVLEIDKNVSYGSTPVYDGEIPTKEPDEKIYLFSGWTPAISSVTGDITYSAQFTDAANKHTVVFYDEDGKTELGRVVVGHNEKAEYPYTLPTKESTAQTVYTFDKWVKVQGESEEADLNCVSSDMSVFASYTTSLRKYTVTFTNWDGTVIEEQAVEYGKEAIAPELVPHKERDNEFLYEFAGWDGNYNSIVEDTIVKADFNVMVEVCFVDYDNSVIDIQIVPYGQSAEYPNDPERSNYKFVGWSNNVENLTESLTVKALYEMMYKVVFVDYNGNVIKTVYTCKGEKAEAPLKKPTREGYNFVEWDTDFSSVKSNLTVTAVYQIKRYTVTFVYPDKSIISTVKNIKHGFSVEAPSVNDVYFDWSKNKAYFFTGWDCNLESIIGDTVVNATYTREVNEPVIIVKSVDIEYGTVSAIVKAYICWNENFYGVSLDANFDKVLKLGGKTTVSVDVAYGDENIDFTSKLTDDCIYELRWTNGDGISPSDYSGPVPLVTFSFSLNEFQNVGEYLVNILDSTYIIDENFVKITPIIISGAVTIKE